MPPEGHPLPPRGWPSGFVAGPEDRDALVVLSHLDGLTPRRLHALAWAVARARACLDAVRAGRAGTDSDRDRSRKVSVDGVRSTLRRVGARQVCPGDPEYPAPLLDLPDPPATLFVRGSARLDEISTGVAMVGSRRCSPYGREVGEWLARGLARAGVTVVSGAALGIDAACHRGALAGVAGPVPPTVAVLGSGIDRPHPPGNRDLIRRIAERGAVVTEYPPGTRALPFRFPARNRIVAGLARAAVVVEGALGSGSMITAEFAMELGREVLAVPGPVTGDLSAVPHQLIREGAGLIRSAEDVLDALGLEVAPGPPGAPATDLSPHEARILEAVAGTPITADQVAAEAGLPTGDALAGLAALELRGLVRVVGGRFERALPATRA